MSKFVNLPFGEMWNDFNVESFKKDINELIDSIYSADEQEETNDLVAKLDDMLMGFVIVCKLKDVENIEVVEAANLPKEILDELEIDLEDPESKEQYIPKFILPDEILESIEDKEKQAKKKESKSKKDWLK